jgi:hypothetical protein
MLLNHLNTHCQLSTAQRLSTAKINYDFKSFYQSVL